MPTATAMPETRATDLERLRDSLHGPLILSGDEGYDEARSIWNGASDRRPGKLDHTWEHGGHHGTG
jgi:hypothetical protein